MKKTILILAAFSISFGTSAQMLNKSMSQAHKEFRNTYQARVPL